MKIKYDILQNGELVIAKYSGQVDIKQMVLFIEYIQSIPEGIKIKNLISDYRELKPEFTIRDINLISKVTSVVTYPLGNITHVHLVNNPEITALSMFYCEKIERSNPNAFVCSTVEKALAILHLQIEAADINNTLNNLIIEFTEHELARSN